ncbi:MAG: hypothetical protein RIA64_01825 [Rhodospirillales bacterium]
MNKLDSLKSAAITWVNQHLWGLTGRVFESLGWLLIISTIVAIGRLSGDVLIRGFAFFISLLWLVTVLSALGRIGHRIGKWGLDSDNAFIGLVFWAGLFFLLLPGVAAVVMGVIYFYDVVINLAVKLSN